MKKLAIDKSSKSKNKNKSDQNVKTFSKIAMEGEEWQNDGV